MAAVALFVVLVARDRPLRAWGFDAHFFIVERAIDVMPEPIRPFFEKHRAFVVSHTIDPDLWRHLEWEPEESPRHFIDLDSYGEFPFAELPRDYEAAVQKHGRNVIQERGVLPWRVADVHQRLAKAFGDAAAGRSTAADGVRFFAAVLAHYVADGHVPLHTTRNHDGQLTGQSGIHARWESDLFLRYRNRLKIAPPPVTPVKEPRDAMFEVLLDSYRFVEPLLAADRRAAEGRELYDDPYYEALFGAVRPMLERQMSRAAGNVAAFIAGAWETAGRPVLPLEVKKVPRKIRQ